MNYPKTTSLTFLYTTIYRFKEKIEDDSADHFQKVVGDIYNFGDSTNKMLDKMVKTDEHWFTGPLMKFLLNK